MKKRNRQEINVASLIKEIQPGIYSIRIPLPGKNPGPANVYVITGQEVTLIDVGPKQTVHILGKALEEIGISFADIKNIILTHGHLDHYGAAWQIRKASGAKVKAHQADKRVIETGSEISNRAGWKLLTLLGMPTGPRFALLLMKYLFNVLLVDDCPVDEVLEEGELLQLGPYTGKVISTPGHTRGSICIYLEKEDILFSGDHILGHITPNAFVMLEYSHPWPQRMSQMEFLSSVGRIEQINPGIIYTGHGQPVTDFAALTQLYRQEFIKRQNYILDIIALESLTIYEITKILFPNLKGKRYYFDLWLAISEVLTHLQVLQHEKKVSVELRKPYLVYKKVAD